MTCEKQYAVETITPPPHRIGPAMSKYNPKDAVTHIVHDYMYLVLAGREKHLDYPLNHYAERTFLTHCRALADFFDSDRDSKSDIHASDFTKTKLKADLSIWEKWRKHLNKHLMHLTVGRIKNKTPWDGTDNKKMLREFENAWDKFMDELKPGLKPLFEAEIKRRGGL